jgi:hypothetical protein
MKNILLPIEELLQEKNVAYNIISHDEKYEIIKKWKCVFFQSLTINQVEMANKFLWHIFSFNYIKALEKEIAIDAFNRLNVKRYTIFSSNIKSTGILCESSLLPSYEEFAKAKTSSPELFDLYINQINLKWTFVITHEPNFGPYLYHK